MVSWHPYNDRYSVTRFSTVIIVHLVCQIFGQKVFLFHLTHIGYLQTVQVLSVKLFDCFQKQWWIVTKVNKENHSLFHLIRVFMVELFDVVSMGKCFKWETSTLVVCWPQKQQQKGGGGGCRFEQPAPNSNRL